MFREEVGVDRVRRFVVTVGSGVLTDEEAARIEAAIQEAVATTLADLDLTGRLSLIDPVRESEKEAAKGFDWRNLLVDPMPGLVASPRGQLVDPIGKNAAGGSAVFTALKAAVEDALAGMYKSGTP